MSYQQSFTDLEYANRKKKTKREEFLEMMDEIIPWDEWVSIVEPYYPSGKRGRPTRGIETMLRMYFLQNWFNLSDEGIEDAIYDSYAFRKFMKIDFFNEQVPDATTLCKFRRKNASYCCPNCGAVSTVEELLSGCSFCGTKFLMTDLYPKISSIYTQKELGSKVKRRLRKAIISAIKDGYLYFGAGRALGFDTLAAQTILELKKKYPDIRLILILPCLSQTRHWSEADISEYERIKSEAGKVVYTSKEYTRDCMFKRNRHLVDNSSLCICYLTEQSGGTAHTVSYAKNNNLIVDNIADN